MGSAGLFDKTISYVARIVLLLGVSPNPLYAQNILLISIDTLRADHLSCYGYRGNNTPAIDRWASEGIRFEKAYSEYPLTLPSHSTLLTGVYPLKHGVRENVGFVLAGAQETLAEILRKNGYVTAGFIGSYVLASEFGIARGFDTYDDRFGPPVETVIAATALRRSSEQVTDRFLNWLAGNRQGKFLTFVHFYDPHAPCPAGYDAEVSRVDRSIARIDAFLRKANLLDKTHIFLVSDHGESLGEHGESGHGFFLYDATLHVPLIIKPATGFSYSRKTLKQAVSLVDVAPTILQMAGLPMPAGVQGRSLVPLMRGHESEGPGVYAETYVPQLQFGWSPLRSYRSGRYVLIDAPRAELYDLEADPMETVNLYDRERMRARQYRERLLDIVSRSRGQSAVRAAQGPSREAAEKLASLGYVRLDRSKESADFGTGIDPKDRIGVFESYHEVLYEIGNRTFSPGILARIGTMRIQAPELRSLHFLEAQVCEGLGRLQDAEAKYRQGLSLEQRNVVARAGFAGLLLRVGKTDEAEREFRRVLLDDPADYRSRNNLAGICRMKGRPEEAVTELRKALETRPTYASGWLNLGQLYMQSKNLIRAEAALRKAVYLDRASARAHLLLAQVLKAEGKMEEADREMKSALKLDPGLAGSPRQ